MQRYSFIDELDAHIFIQGKIDEYIKREKIEHYFIQYSFSTTPGVVDTEYVAYDKIKNGAFILSSTIYFLYLYTVEDKSFEIPFAVVYRNDYNNSVVFLFLDI